MKAAQDASRTLAEGAPGKVSKDSPRIVLASNNAHKLAEIGERLGPAVEVVAPRTLGEPPDPDEWGERFAVNAAIKAVAFAAWAGMPALADDSGLEVDALAGAPGVRSARFAGPDASDAENNRELLDRLAGERARGARFRCVLALAWPAAGAESAGAESAAAESSRSEAAGMEAAGMEAAAAPPERVCALSEVPDEGACVVRAGGALWRVVLVPGAVSGEIARDLQGSGGFGYDPLFVLADGRRMAELSRDEKAAVSHRGAALAALRSCGVLASLPAVP